MNVSKNDRYEHRESKAPVIVIEALPDRTGFGHDSVTYSFLCGNNFAYTVPLGEFLKWYKPGMGEL